uniref:Sidoreflexin n=1 Tax=Setaria digitata TaxID=48799 RepID=A0A915PCS7_9BILA
MSVESRSERYDVSCPRWDQSKFLGRLRYFVSITDPLKAFVSQDTLQESKRLLELYRSGKEPHGTTVEDLQRAQAFYGSAFHPDTGQLQTLPGRMCANAWGGTMLCGAMMLWYKDLLVGYTSAVTGALGVAIGLKNYLAKHAFSSMSQRFVPFVAVSVANAINIPLTRQNELLNGIPVTNDEKHVVTKSKLAACKAISLVVFSRNVIVAPTMLLIPLIMNAMEKYSWYTNRAKFLNIPLQLILTFVLSVKVATLMQYEPAAYEELKRHMGLNMPATQLVFFNKGL